MRSSQQSSYAQGTPPSPPRLFYAQLSFAHPSCPFSQHSCCFYFLELGSCPPSHPNPPCLRTPLGQRRLRLCEIRVRCLVQVAAAAAAAAVAVGAELNGFGGGALRLRNQPNLSLQGAPSGSGMCWNSIHCQSPPSSVKVHQAAVSWTGLLENLKRWIVVLYWLCFTLATLLEDGTLFGRLTLLGDSKCPWC